MKFVTSFGFRAGLVATSHLFGLIALIAGGEWLALAWLILASMWAALAFIQESRLDSQAILIDGLTKRIREDRRVP